MSNDDDEIQEIKNELENIKSQTRRLENRIDQLSQDEDSKTESSTRDNTQNDTVEQPTPTQKTPSESKGQSDGSNSIYNTNIENLVGGKLFLYLGSAALIIATLFLIQLAISAGLIGPLGRVLLAFIGGAVITSAGQYAHSNMNSSLWGRVAVGTGYIVSYIAVYGAYGSTTYREALGTPFWLMCALITALVVISFAHVWRFDFRRVSIVPAVLLWITVIIVGSNTDIQTVYLAYIAAAVLSTVGITYLKRWGSPILPMASIGFFSITLLFNEFRGGVELPEQILLILLIFVVVVTAIELRREVDVGQLLTVNILSGVNILSALTFIGITYNFEGTAMGYAILTIFIGISIALFRNTLLERPKSTIAETILIFPVLAISASVIGDTTLRIILLSALILVIFGAQRYRTNEWVTIVSHIASAALVFDAYVFISNGSDPTFLPIEARYAEAITLVALLTAVYTVFWLSKEEPNIVTSERLGFINNNLSQLYSWGGVILLALLGMILFSEVMLSVVWAVTGVSLLLIGAKTKYSIFRIQGLSIVGLTIGKVFLIDTSGLDPVPRIISFMFLGAVLLGISFLYNKREDLDIPIIGDIFD